MKPEGVKLLEVKASLRRARKEDLFTGDIFNVKGKQAVKDCVTVFFRHPKTKQLSGPQIIWDHSCFSELYSQMLYGFLGVLAPAKGEKDFVFDLVLREAFLDDLTYTPKHTKLNRLFYLYDNQMIAGPYYIDNSYTVEYLQAMIAQNKVFIPYERQHFKLRNH